MLPFDRTVRSPERTEPGSARTPNVGYTWQYYDGVLFGVAASASGAPASDGSRRSLLASIGAFSVPSMLIVGHGLFVNGSIDEPADLTEEVETLN